MNNVTSAVIVAGGQGRRMGCAVAKQYLPLGGKPIVSRTLERFLDVRTIDIIVLVMPAGDMAMAATWLPDNARVKITAGGVSRRQSVLNGLQAIDAREGIVLIHDGVRPLVNAELIAACIQGARDWGACIPAMPVNDTVKQVDTHGLVQATVSRRGLWLAQTPQAFDLALIRNAHQQAQTGQWDVTDDAALIERMGAKVKIIPGSRDNIKITSPDDLRLAEVLLGLNPLA